MRARNEAPLVDTGGAQAGEGFAGGDDVAFCAELREPRLSVG
jgi:hypothetical protein